MRFIILVAVTGLVGCASEDSTLECGAIPVVTVTSQYSPTAISASSTSSSDLAVDFGLVPIGQTGTLTFTIAYAGSNALDLRPDAASLDLEFGVGASSASTAPDVPTTVTVTFQPYKTGLASSGFTIPLTAPHGCPSNPTVPVSLKGEGIQLSLVIQPNVLDFGDTVIGTTAQKSVTLINQSSASIDGISATVGGGDHDLFTVDNIPATLSANAVAVIDLSYTPVALETRSLANVIFEGADGEKATLNLFGEPVEQNDAGLECRASHPGFLAPCATGSAADDGGLEPCCFGACILDDGGGFGVCSCPTGVDGGVCPQ